MIAAGAVLVVLAALAFMWVQLRADARVSVLVVARAVAAGHLITPDDVRAAPVAADASVRVVPAAQVATVVGRSAAVPLVAGTLLSPDQVGPLAWPPAGEAVVALPVKPGRMPAGITPGARVRVLPVASDTTNPSAGSNGGSRDGVVATVVEVGANVDASGTLVMSLLLASGDVGVAGNGREATLVLLGPQG